MFSLMYDVGVDGLRLPLLHAPISSEYWVCFYVCSIVNRRKVLSVIRSVTTPTSPF